MGTTTLFEDMQRRVVLTLLLSGLIFAAIGVFMTPSGDGYWLAVVAAPLLGGAAGFVLGGAPGRAVDAWMMRDGAPKQAPSLFQPSALPPSDRAALQTALLPLLLSNLSIAADRMAPREKAAALALVEAGATAPGGEAREVLAHDLPRLIGALAAGRDAAAAETEALARRLAQPMERRP